MCKQLSQLNICPFTEWVYHGKLCLHCQRVWGRLNPIDRDRTVMQEYYKKYEWDREAYRHFVQQIYDASTLFYVKYNDE